MIGQMSYHLGRLDEAQARLEQAIAIRRAAGGDAAGDLASSLIHLAWVHRTRNQYERARALVGEALDLRRGSLPPAHPDIAEAYYELGWVTFGREQERLYRQALEILSGVPGAAEQRITILQALSTNVRRQGRLAEAVAAGRQALAISLASFGRQHHTTGDAMIHLADHVSDIEGDDEAAERLYRDGIDLVGRHFGDHSVRLLHGLNSLGRLMSRRGDAEAETLYRRALGISLSATGPGHPRVADQMHKLASALARQGRLAEAEPLAREALDLTVKAVGNTHQLVASSRLPLIAEILDMQRRFAEADRVYESAFELGAHERRDQRRDAPRLRPHAAAPRRRRRRRDAAAAIAVEPGTGLQQHDAPERARDQASADDALHGDAASRSSSSAIACRRDGSFRTDAHRATRRRTSMPP